MAADYAPMLTFVLATAESAIAISRSFDSAAAIPELVGVASGRSDEATVLAFTSKTQTVALAASSSVMASPLRAMGVIG